MDKGNELNIISRDHILPEDTFTKLKSIKKDLEDGFKRRQRFRPRFLMETSVLNDMKFPTPDAKYWQCNVERDVHFRNLVMLSFDYREKQVDIEILEAEIGELTSNEINKAKSKKKQVQIDRHKQQLIYMVKEAKERVREIFNWTDIMKKLESKLKYDPDDAEAWMPEGFTLRSSREIEAMETAGRLNAHDMDGAINMISFNKTLLDNKKVKDLLGNKTKKIEE